MLPNARVAATADALRALSCGYYSQLSHIALCCFNNERKHTPGLCMKSSGAVWVDKNKLPQRNATI